MDLSLLRCPHQRSPHSKHFDTLLDTVLSTNSFRLVFPFFLCCIVAHTIVLLSDESGLAFIRVCIKLWLLIEYANWMSRLFNISSTVTWGVSKSWA